MIRELVKWCRSAVRHSSTVQLRDYQQHVIDRCIDRIVKREGPRVRIGVSLATGGGKTVIFSNLVKQLSEKHGFARTLILAHRRELVMQAAGTVRKCIPHSSVQIEMGKCVASLDRSAGRVEVVIASTQSLIRRLDNHPRDYFDLIIIDEAHHAVANSYLKILDHYDGAVPVVGFSATFERADNKALSTVMDEIVYHRGILEMISDKWLCEGKFTTVNIDCDLSKVELSSGTKDFKLDKLSSALNTEQLNEVVLNAYLHKRAANGFKSTLLFAVDIKHVESLYQLFRDRGVTAGYVTSNTPTEKRDQIVRDFRAGRIEVLINCGIFTEGTDMPNIDCILLCRPTRSRSLLIQMIGRGLRLHHSKDHCHIIDFVGASNVGVVSVPTLAGIEHFQGTLQDATMSDLLKIKEEIELERNRQLEKEEAYQESFHAWLNEIDSFDLTLSTFDNFRSFYDQQQTTSAVTDMALDERTFFPTSVYPWVKFAKDGWGFSLHNGHHLRLYKQNIKGNAVEYVLRLYREIPHYLRDKTGVRFIPRELIKTGEFSKAISKVAEVIEILSKTTEDNSSVKNFTRFAKWRKQPATVKQKNSIKRKLQSRLNTDGSSYPSLSPIDIATFADRLNKGEASNILFATSLASVYPIKSLLKVLEYKKAKL
ncbi:hypothetical protein HG536_0E02620 [Torulaspora globosa]|uniref:ATP-dependent helicase IRC3 n=1 Tax=Torulaspora globosa TaxID=48254 RepID=A0A7G3ZIL5_9SACH|nr:uncharacterized protein HG536_0E02620 [Torulaspora globosa]QLL33351.1 hypothetical protein HG536_0E02620 [Torulaspora globosa]